MERSNDRKNEIDRTYARRRGRQPSSEFGPAEDKESTVFLNNREID